MSAIKNHILFNHTYLQQLQDDNTIDEEAAAVAQGVRDWYAFCDASSIQTVIDSWVSPMLSILELEIQPLAEHTPHSHLLYSSWDLQNPVGLCYVTPPGADLDTTSKGQHWLAQAVLAARRWQNDSQNNSPLRWVILTNGDLWRLLDAHSLRRYEAYLQVDLGQIARGAGDITALRIFFYHCFHRHAFVTPKLDKPNGLEQLLTASERATGQAEKHLKARVSHNEGIMAQLCLGFVRAAGSPALLKRNAMRFTGMPPFCSTVFSLFFTPRRESCCQCTTRLMPL
ncbi:MAG: hypothetical protein M5U34_45430 [Chloroflexi bacterium]|nr:hypothetical protein [Chloroflexota bacterium]